MVKFAGCI